MGRTQLGLFKHICWISFLGLLVCENAAGQTIPYSWQISSIPVFDEAGNAFHRPFLGGFNVPRPQLVDIDADDDLDLFIQEKSNQIVFFENDSQITPFPFVWKSSHFQSLEVGEWYRFVDIDADGDQDLLAEQPFSFIRYYKNTGTAESPSFELAADTLFDDAGAPVFADRQNIPNVVDIDCNDQLDLFIGRLDGTIVHYEIASFNGVDAPVFELKSERFQDIKIVTGGGKHLNESSRHGANTLTFVDVDADGDSDLFWGDFFEVGLLFFENTGTCDTPVFSTFTAFPPSAPLQTSGYNAPTFGDVDRDGRLDLLVGVLGGAFSSSSNTADNLLFFSGIDGSEMELQTQRFLSNLDFGNDSLPVLQDLDSDGDFDLVVTNSIDTSDNASGASFVFENRGSVTNPVYYQVGPLMLEPAYNYAPAFADLDDDGDDDMLVGSWNGLVAYYKKAGNLLDDFVLENASLLDLPAGSNSTPTLADIDGDGDFDVVAGEANGTLNFYRNTGTPSLPSFELPVEDWEGIDAGRRSVPSFKDLDDDGDLDLITGSDKDSVQFYRNIGDAQNPAFQQEDLFDLPPGRRFTPTLADLDADGDVDLITGGLEGGLMYFENETVVSSVLKYSEPATALINTYPNPSSEYTILRISSKDQGRIEVNLMDVTGREIRKIYAGWFGGGETEMNVDLAGLSEGVYFLRIVDELGRVQVHSVIKLR